MGRQSAGVRTLDRPGPGAYDSGSALAAMDSESRDAVAAGADVLHQAGFFDGRLVGWVDFVERDPATGAWGVCDAKLARTERVTALLQLAAYAHLLSRTSFAVQPQVHLALVSGQRISRRVDELVPVFLTRTERPTTPGSPSSRTFWPSSLPWRAGRSTGCRAVRRRS